MSHHRPQEALAEEVKSATKLVKVGGVYSHYKHPENHYKVLYIATQEATDKLCVIYQSEYGQKLIFVRDLDDWLSEVEFNGQKVPRFKLL